MLYKSKQCDLRSKAREVLLTWARARAYRDRAIRYLRLAHLASDSNVRNRFNAIARHYRELAEIERRVANERAPHNHQSQSTTNQSHSRRTSLFRVCLIGYYFWYDDYRPIRSCTRQRLPPCTKFARPEGKSLVLSLKPSHSAKMLVHAFVSNAAASACDGTDNVG